MIQNNNEKFWKNVKIETITKDNSYYPESLKNVFDPPEKLYCAGNIEILKSKKLIAIIGCREYTEYGRLIAETISYTLSEAGIIVVSGCARGIDSFAHKGAVKAGKPTIAVLGNGLNYIYPPENKELEEQILKNSGLIISEYPIGTKPSKETFPRRNRIISGLSDGVLVVEAKKKSGSLITVDYALEQGKNIYAIPGNIININSEGTNELIKQGAKMVTQINDILEDYRI